MTVGIRVPLQLAPALKFYGEPVRMPVSSNQTMSTSTSQMH
jgi:hypothetical protein